MKTFLQLTFCFYLFVFTNNISAQVTKLSNNTNLNLAITLNDKALLSTDKDSVWVTDGTAGGTFKLINDAITTKQAVVYKNKIYAGVLNAAKGAELWVSDCTPSGTKLFKDINAGSKNSYPTNFFVFNNTLFFFAYTNADGYELWKSNGTASGTVMVKDIYQGKGSSFDSNSTSFFYPANGVLFFIANDSTHGREIWKTDGTSAGTKLVKDLNPGTASFDISTYNSLNNQFIFSGKDGDVNGIKIWKTDGTSAGTDLIKKLFPNDDCSFVNAVALSKFKDKLVFATEGFIFAFPLYTMVNSLYATDATNSGTKLIIDLADSSLSYFSVTLTPTIDDKFYFTTYTKKGSLLWQSNATANGTKVIKSIGTSLNLNTGHFPLIFTDFYVTNPDSISTKNFNGKFFIAADDGTHGYEPWITDGTGSGTRLVKDIYKNSGSSLELDSFTFAYSKQGLYFSANDNSTGKELWLSDGTAPGTKEVADINPGNKSSNPFIVGFLKKHLLISANDGDNAQNKTDLYQVNKTFDTLKTINAVAETIAPDGTRFSVYPNPAKDQLNINLDKNISTQRVSFIITDAKGKQVYANELSGRQLSAVYNIDISKLSQGNYYLQLITDKGVSSTKFVKIK